MTLGHTHSTLEWSKVSNCPIMGDPGKDGANCLSSLVSWVACTGTVFHDTLSVFSRHLFTCTLSHTSDPVSLRCDQVWRITVLTFTHRTQNCSYGSIVSLVSNLSTVNHHG